MIVLAAVVVMVQASAYCAGTSCGALKHGITKSGARPVAGYTAACDPAVLPQGSGFLLPGAPDGYRGPWVCEDVGSAIKGRRVDLYLHSRTAALRWGRRRMRLRVLWRPGQRAAELPWYGPGCPGEAR